MNAAGTTRVEVKQSALDGLGLAGSVALLADLRAEGFAESRLDGWLDDYQGRITPARVRAAVLEDLAVTHARPGRWVHDDEDGSSTYYLGSVTSDRRTRTYDKRGPTRHELQARRAAARSFGDGLMNGEPARAVLSNLVSFADFREGRGRDHRTGERVPRLDWWHELVGESSKAEGAPSRPRLSIEELAVYFERFWSRSVALLVDEFGPGYLDQVLRLGRMRLADGEEVAS